MAKITVEIETKDPLTPKEIEGMIGSKDNVNKRRKLPKGGVLGVSVEEVEGAKSAKPAASTPTKKAATKKAATKKDDDKESGGDNKDTEV